MADDLALLPAEVRYAIRMLDEKEAAYDHWNDVRAELLRLVRENAEFLTCYESARVGRDGWRELSEIHKSERDAALFANRDCVDHFDALKADYDALRKRIDDAPTTTVMKSPAPNRMVVDGFDGYRPEYDGKRVALVLLDGGEV